VLCLATIARAAEPDKQTPPDPWTVQARTDRPEALYTCGETAVFSITALRDGRPPVAAKTTAVLTLDGGRVIDTRDVDISAGPVTLQGTLSEPGFLRLTVTVTAADERRQALSAAAFEPERIRKASAEPADFERFWEDGRKRLNDIPPDLRLTRLEAQCSATVEAFALSFANIGQTRIYGFLCVPLGKPGPFPAWVTVPGAGPGPFAPSGRNYAERGVLALTMGVHAYDVGALTREQNEAAYNELNRTLTYSHQGAPDREAYYFRRALLGIDRAISWLAARPDFDGKHLVIDGSSQGGAAALILAGLNRKITAAAANVPALCDHGGYLAGRTPGWPRLVKGNTDEEKRPILDMAGYFDAAHFAGRITGPVIVSVGFVDLSCSPSSVYAAFNEIRAPKRLFNGPRNGHEMNVGDYRGYVGPWVDGQLGLAAPTAPQL
jgi:cephalosporin-C deacetylase-like acetyl esterase